MGKDTRRHGPGEAVGNPPEGAGPIEAEHDTEGNLLRPQAPIPPVRPVGPGEQFVRGDGTPADFLDERDTEGHIQFRHRPADGGE